MKWKVGKLNVCGVPSCHLPDINEERQKMSTQVAGLGAQIPNIRKRHVSYLITTFDLEVTQQHRLFAVVGRK